MPSKAILEVSGPRGLFAGGFALQERSPHRCLSQAQRDRPARGIAGAQCRSGCSLAWVGCGRGGSWNAAEATRGRSIARESAWRASVMSLGQISCRGSASDFRLGKLWRVWLSGPKLAKRRQSACELDSRAGSEDQRISHVLADAPQGPLKTRRHGQTGARGRRRGKLKDSGRAEASEKHLSAIYR